MRRLGEQERTARLSERLDLDRLAGLPGAEIVLDGLADLEARRDSVHSNAVRMASTRLRAAGIDVPEQDVPSERAPHRLYELVAADDPRNAHSRYNAIVRRLVSFMQAVERARAS